MARNLFLGSVLALLAGCASPELPPSPSGNEAFIPSTGTTGGLNAAAVGTGAAGATGTTAAVPTTPATPTGKTTGKKKLPLGTVHQK